MADTVDSAARGVGADVLDGGENFGGGGVEGAAEMCGEEFGG